MGKVLSYNILMWRDLVVLNCSVFGGVRGWAGDGKAYQF